MTPSEYTSWCRRFDNHLPIFSQTSLALGLCSEAGEVAGEYETWCRQGFDPLDAEAVATELGDCLWNIARLADELGYTLEELMEANVNKLLARYEEKGTPLR